MPQHLEDAKSQQHSFYLMISISARPVDAHGKKSREAVQIERWLFSVTQNTREQIVKNLKKTSGQVDDDLADTEIGMLELQKFTEETQQVKSKLMEGCRVVKSLLMSMPGWKMVNSNQ